MADGFLIADALGGLFSAFTDAGMQFNQMQWQREMFEEQKELQLKLANDYNNMVMDNFNKQLDFQKSENEIMRQREDSAIQRRAADLKAAGINPLIAGSSPASASLGGTSFSTPNFALPSVNSPIPSMTPRFGGLPSLSGLRKVGSETDVNNSKLLNDEIDRKLKSAQTDLTNVQIAQVAQNIEYIAQQTMTEKERTRFTRWVANTQNVEFERSIRGLSLDNINLRNAEEMSDQELIKLKEEIDEVRTRTAVSVSKEVRGWVTDLIDGASQIVETVMSSRGIGKYTPKGK